MKLYKFWNYTIQKSYRLLGNWKGEFNNPLVAVSQPFSGVNNCGSYHSTPDPTRGVKYWAESSPTPAASEANRSLYASRNFHNQKA